MNSKLKATLLEPNIPIRFRPKECIQEYWHFFKENIARKNSLPKRFAELPRTKRLLCIYSHCYTPDAVGTCKPTIAETSKLYLYTAVRTGLSQRNHQSTTKGSFGQLNCFLRKNPRTSHTETLFSKTPIAAFNCVFVGYTSPREWWSWPYVSCIFLTRFPKSIIKVIIQIRNFKSSVCILMIWEEL